MPSKKKGTSPRVAAEAAHELGAPESTKPQRSVAGSDLSQAGHSKKAKKKGKK